MTTTAKVAILLAGVFAFFLATQAAGWVAASDSSGSSPERPDTLLIEEGGGVAVSGVPGKRFTLPWLSPGVISPSGAFLTYCAMALY